MLASDGQIMKDGAQGIMIGIWSPMLTCVSVQSIVQHGTFEGRNHDVVDAPRLTADGNGPQPPILPGELAA